MTNNRQWVRKTKFDRRNSWQKTKHEKLCYYQLEALKIKPLTAVWFVRGRGGSLWLGSKHQLISVSAVPCCGGQGPESPYFTWVTTPPYSDVLALISRDKFNVTMLPVSWVPPYFVIILCSFSCSLFYAWHKDNWTWLDRDASDLQWLKRCLFENTLLIWQVTHAGGTY